MNTFRLINTGISISHELNYLVEIYPELANHDKLRKIVQLGHEWNEQFSAMIAGQQKDLGHE